jgi:hypothetical protein
MVVGVQKAEPVPPPALDVQHRYDLLDDVADRLVTALR